MRQAVSILDLGFEKKVIFLHAEAKLLQALSTLQKMVQAKLELKSRRASIHPFSGYFLYCCFVNRRQHICLGEAERTREDSNLQNSLCFKPLGSERQQCLIQWAAGPGDAGALSSTMCIIGKQFLGSSRWSLLRLKIKW